MQIFKYILRVIVGVTFIFSALAKFFTIDAFEIYLFSLELFPLGISFIMTRVIIGVEALLGLWFIANMNVKLTNIVAYVMLGFFSGILFGQILSGNSENCHCFGDLIDMSPRQSIIKNAILIILVLFSTGKGLFLPKHRTLWNALTTVVAFSSIFILSPPDNFRYESYKSDDMVNESYLMESIDKGILTDEILVGEKILCFFSVRCEYCAMSAKKLGILRRLGDFSRAEVISYFGKGEETDVEDIYAFLSESKLDCNSVHFIKPNDFLKITNGSFPLILLMKDGKITEKYSYRDLH